MKERRRGRIPNVSSVAAFTENPDLWYGVTKAGLLNLTKAWPSVRTREMAATILWLGSACPEYVNGTKLDVNNGSYPR